MRALTLVLLAILGVPLTLGGVYLLALGGSAFYFISGVAVLAAAFGFFKRARWALPVYAGWMVVLLIWSLWESGLHWWPLATRLGLPAIIGFIMALPASRRSAHDAVPVCLCWLLRCCQRSSLLLAFLFTCTKPRASCPWKWLTQTLRQAIQLKPKATGKPMLAATTVSVSPSSARSHLRTCISWM